MNEQKNMEFIYQYTQYSSITVSRNLLKDLRWNIKYPDEEIAKNLDSLDEASRSFGVRNMVNCLSLLDGYFSELQTQLDK